MLPHRFISHGKRAASIGRRFGWLPGARYTNLRDVRGFDRVGFLDIDWRRYCFRRHLSAARSTRPILTVARDVESKELLPEVLDQAWALAEYAERVIVVPKDPQLKDDMNELIPPHFVLGYSVPSAYGRTRLCPSRFTRDVHLLGGRPDVQRRLGAVMSVFSFDCNRFTLDAAFGDYFDGYTFRPHPTGGYERCIEDSLRNINAVWSGYSPHAKEPERPGQQLLLSLAD